MTHDDALLRALAELDQPVDPPAAFADRLERQMRAEAGPSRPKVTPPPTAAPIPLPVSHERPRRSRLSTFAGLAAAVLLIAIIGNLWSLTRDTGQNPAATVVVPTSEPATTPQRTYEAVMPGGSAAHDGHFPGPVPTGASYTRLWQRSIPNMGFSALYDDALYYLAFADDGSPNNVVALDAATGEERWRHPLASNSSFSLIYGGVVIASAPKASEPQAFQVQLLDYKTGAVLWASGSYQYPARQTHTEINFVIVGSTIMVQNGSSIIGFAAGGGQERWHYETPQNADQTCPDCVALTLAAYGNTAYFIDGNSGQLVALSIIHGERLWSVTLTDRIAKIHDIVGDSSGMPVQLTAVDQGVIVTSPTGYFGLLSATDGAPVWESTDNLAVYQTVRARSSLFITSIVPRAGKDPQWRWSEIDIATGAVLRSGSDHQERFANMAYLTSSNLLIGGYRSKRDSSWWEKNVPLYGALFGSNDKSDDSVGMDPVTLDVVWESSIENCIINLPVAPDGKILCSPAGGEYGEIAVYAPKP